ncbi:MAG: hypothetical protein H6Q04_1287 [Acidobacteria bacterium]|jgi:hypothetical protein|nr:hypothetical protein [Acidobacteriota bacterium]
MLKPRTKLLIILSGLVPASIPIIKLDTEAALQEGKLEGYLPLCGQPTGIIKAMFCVGCIACLFAIVSTVLDVRRPIGKIGNGFS